jgi:hypothetical protein
LGFTIKALGQPSGSALKPPADPNSRDLASPGGGGLCPPEPQLRGTRVNKTRGLTGESGFPLCLKKSWGHRFHGGPNPVTSVEVVEALPA